jgi:hypothetical protein
MNRPTFVTMSTLAFTIVAYVALAQAAHADGLSQPAGAIESREVPPSGAYRCGGLDAYNHGNAACRIGGVVRAGMAPVH